MPTAHRAGYLLCALAALVWAWTSPGLSYLLDAHGISPLVVAFWRDAFIAVACLAGLLVLQPAALRVSRADLRGFALTGAISIGVYHAIFVTSIALNGAALAIVLIYLYPIFVALGARIFFKEPVSPAVIVGMALALVGCVLLVRAYDPAVISVSWLGLLVGVASALTHAGYVLFNQRAVTRHSPWVSLALTMFFGTLVLAGLTLAFEGPRAFLEVGVGPLPWLVIAAVALGPTLMGYFFFTSSLRHIPGSVASLIVVVEAPIATLIAVLLLGERLDASQIVGMALILAAAVLPSLPFRLARARPAVAGD